MSATPASIIATTPTTACRRRRRAALRACAAPLLVAAAAAAAQTVGDDVTTDAVRFEQCIVCHGANANGNPAVQGPSLSALPQWYVEAQLVAYRGGIRGGHPGDENGQVMRAVAAQLDDDTLRAAARYVTSLPWRRTPPTPGAAGGRDAGEAGGAEVGRELYAAACSACHGEQGLGNAAVAAPPLAGQSPWYLARQLRHYRDGVRGSHPADPWGGVMQAAARSLPDDEDIDDVVAWIDVLTDANTRTISSKESDAMKRRAFDVLPATALTLGLAAGLAAAIPADAAEITRYPLPGGSTFPIALAVETPPGTTLIHHSGLTPRPAHPDAEPGSRWYWGDTKAQALSVFSRMQSSLESMGLGFGDVIKMTVFLVGDEEKDGRMDFSGFMEAYTQYFGTEEQPNLPARSAVQVAGLAGEGMLVEIEVILARPPAEAAAAVAPVAGDGEGMASPATGDAAQD